MTTENNCNNIMDNTAVQSLGKEFNTRAHEKNFHIRAKLDWTNVSEDLFLQHALAGWIVAIQSRLRKLSSTDLEKYTSSDSVIDVGLIMAETQSVSLKEQVVRKSEIINDSFKTAIKKMAPENWISDNPKQCQKLLIKGITDGIAVVFEFDFENNTDADL